MDEATHLDELGGAWLHVGLVQHIGADRVRADERCNVHGNVLVLELSEVSAESRPVDRQLELREAGLQASLHLRR